MKSIKTAVLGALVLAAGAAMANATTIIYINGSTAFRTAAVTAIHNLFDSGSLYYGYTGTSETGQNAGVYSGTILGTVTVIKNTWTGSESGIQATADTSSGTPVNFPSNVPTVNNVPTALLQGTGLQNIDDPTVSNPVGTFDLETPNAAFSDSYQASSAYKSGASVLYVTGSTHKFSALASATVTGTYGTAPGSGVVGAVSFSFYRTGDGDFSNITTDQAQNLYANGYLPEAIFSGSTADENVRVYATGRNTDSGSRVQFAADTQYGIGGSVSHYEPFDSSGALITAVNHTIATIEPWLPDTVNSVAIAAGNSGYNSSGKLSGALGSVANYMVNSTDGTTGGVLVGYVTSPPGGSAVQLTFNGVADTAANIAAGWYTFWGFEHLYYRNGTSSTITPVLNMLASSVFNTYATLSGVRIGDMTVTRGGSNKDGQPISPNYSY